ncbi:hypothetical protein B0H13DRAFT_1936711 [Mycena leptocephala]|nr:hypothetical protein B0H13DRAFT_1936711 [Mycena leptocephala]
MMNVESMTGTVVDDIGPNAGKGRGKRKAQVCNRLLSAPRKKRNGGCNTECEMHADGKMSLEGRVREKKETRKGRITKKRNKCIRNGEDTDGGGTSEGTGAGEETTARRDRESVVPRAWTRSRHINARIACGDRPGFPSIVFKMWVSKGKVSWPADKDEQRRGRGGAEAKAEVEGKTEVEQPIEVWRAHQKRESAERDKTHRSSISRPVPDGRSACGPGKETRPAQDCARAERSLSLLAAMTIWRSQTWGVLPKIHEVCMRETAVLPVFFWAAGVGRGPGEVGVRVRARRGCGGERRR